jgi:hypothetical protein
MKKSENTSKSWRGSSTSRSKNFQTFFIAGGLGSADERILMMTPLPDVGNP